MDRRAIRILFAGNPAISVPALRALAASYTVVGALTNPDRPSGRGKHVEAPPVKLAAIELGIPVIQYDRLRAPAREDVALLRPNLLVSFACGHYFGPQFLSLFSVASINIHPSLLPLYRGCAPIQYALLNGESKTGVSIQRIAATVDSGDILARRIIDLHGDETSESLTKTVADISAPLIVSTIDRLCEGTMEGEAQDDSKASYSAMLRKQDGVIDWHESARAIHSKVRAFYPWPKATTCFNGISLIISSVSGTLDEAGIDSLPTKTIPGTVVSFVKNKGLGVACGDGLLYVARLQLAMKREMDSASFVNGNPGIMGAVLGR